MLLTLHVDVVDLTRAYETTWSTINPNRHQAGHDRCCFDSLAVTHAAGAVAGVAIDVVAVFVVLLLAVSVEFILLPLSILSLFSCFFLLVLFFVCYAGSSRSCCCRRSCCCVFLQWLLLPLSFWSLLMLLLLLLLLLLSVLHFGIGICCSCCRYCCGVFCFCCCCTCC